MSVEFFGVRGMGQIGGDFWPLPIGKGLSS